MITSLSPADGLTDLIVQIGVLILVLVVWWVTTPHTPTGAPK